ncbi:MAG TPA: hypothetical protein VIZ58_10800 [Thermoanaerobaculia bacterium]
MTTRARLAFISTILLGGLLAVPVRGQAIRGEDIVKYLQPGRWEIEIIPDLSRLTEEQRKRYESRGGAGRTIRSTDCLDAHGKSEMMEGLEGTDSMQKAERDAKRDCKTTLTPLGPHEAKMLVSCDIRGRHTELVALFRYTTLEVSRKDPDGREFVFKKARRIGDCK